ncbi:hypothetical protein HPB50_010180 [Hyalomma asiaticum]|uniref:Uncharacterized protein n=1 Tax=Hyalomma asiaticum TaxID=266040 RepID=A0ACB7SV11_HYAAI|nr:hypothetical protein HPB50_010180 [Hyalomma asiaticum]
MGRSHASRGAIYCRPQQDETRLTASEIAHRAPPGELAPRKPDEALQRLRPVSTSTTTNRALEKVREGTTASEIGWRENDFASCSTGDATEAPVIPAHSPPRTFKRSRDIFRTANYSCSSVHSLSTVLQTLCDTSQASSFLSPKRVATRLSKRQEFWRTEEPTHPDALVVVPHDCRACDDSAREWKPERVFRGWHDKSTVLANRSSLLPHTAICSHEFPSEPNVFHKGSAETRVEVRRFLHIPWSFRAGMPTRTSRHSWMALDATTSGRSGGVSFAVEQPATAFREWGTSLGPSVAPRTVQVYNERPSP